MAGFDGNINVEVLVNQPLVSSDGFGVPLLAATGLGVGFTERVRFYEDATTVATDLAAGDITQAVADALNTGLSQSPKVRRQAVGRIENDAAQISTVAYAGTTAVAADAFTIDIDGTPYTFNATGAETPTAIAAAIAPLVNADPNVSAVDSGGGIVTITALVAGDPFTATASETGSGNITSTVATPTPNVSIKTELDAIVADTSGWYGLSLSSRAALQIQRAAEWVLVNDRLLLAQSSDADLLTTATTSIADTLKTLSNDRAGIVYHADDSEWSAWAWLVTKLEADPDEKVTIWAYATLEGVTPQTQPGLTTTELANLLAKDANVYSTLGPNGATGQGRLANALPIDLRITADWTETRINENIQRLFSETSNRNERIPYTDAGIATVAAEVEGILQKGVIVGHFTPESATVTIPRAADVDQATKDSREVTMSFVVEATGAIEKATINGNVVTDL
jgi:hypothetical protein